MQTFVAIATTITIFMLMGALKLVYSYFGMAIFLIACVSVVLISLAIAFRIDARR